MVFYAWFSGYRATSTATPLIPRNITAMLEGLCHHVQLQIKQNNKKISPKCNVLALMTLQTIHYSATGSFTISDAPRGALLQAAAKQAQRKCLQHQNRKHWPKITSAFRGNNAGKKVWEAMGRWTLYPSQSCPFCLQTSILSLYFQDWLLSKANNVPCSIWSWPQLCLEAAEEVGA